MLFTKPMKYRDTAKCGDVGSRNFARPGHLQGECPYDTRPGVYRRDIPLAGVLVPY